MYKGRCVNRGCSKHQFKAHRGYRASSWPSYKFPFASRVNTHLCNRCYVSLIRSGSIKPLKRRPKSCRSLSSTVRNILQPEPQQSFDLSPLVLTAEHVKGIDIFPPGDRKRRAADDLRPTEKNKRIRMLQMLKKNLEHNAGITFEEAGLMKPKISMNEAVQFSQPIRHSIRKVIKAIRVPSTNTVNCKLKQWTVEYGTETASFQPESGLTGAYICDPLKLVDVMTNERGKFVVSGDKGGDWLKFGVIYRNDEDKSKFLCLLVVKADESIETFNALTQPNVTLFVRNSSRFDNIKQVLQYFLSEKQALFVSDYKLMDLVIALKQAGTIWPCPKCIVSVDNLFAVGRTRRTTDKHSRHEYEPFLNINVNKLVPLPLHVMLGFTNKMLKVVKLKMGIDIVVDVCKSAKIKTEHRRGGGGMADLKDLNGPEIRRWHKKKCFLLLIERTSNIKIIKMLRKFDIWSPAVAQFCSQTSPWSPQQYDQFDQLFTDIKNTWTSLTDCPPTPKMHVLQHFPDFARENGSVGKWSESPIESFHWIFDYWMKHHHFNEPNASEQARKSLVGSLIPLVAPIIKKNPTT
jgi:hypothetical protein